MMRRLITAAILIALILFLILDTGILLLRVSGAEGLIALRNETIDIYEYPKEARWMKFDLLRNNDKLKEDKVYIPLSEVPPNEDPGDGFSIVDKDDNPYPEMPAEEGGKVIHTLYQADYGWEWRSLKDVSLRSRAVIAVKNVVGHPIGIKASTFEKNKEGFIFSSIINFLASMALIMIPGVIIYKLVKRGT